MKKVIVLSLVACLSLNLFAQEDENTTRKRHPSVKKAVGSVAQGKVKDVDLVDGFKHMFHDGKVSGQIRMLYNNYQNDTYQNTYATAIGGSLKYELAQYKGFSAAVGFHTSTDIDLLSGDGVKRDTELSSSDESYVVRSQSYINYNYEGLNVRVGRQIIDTPLADSDDIRMIPNSFEAAVVNYEYKSLMFMGGFLDKWQGVDAGLDDGWQDTGDKGTYFGGINYSEDTLEANLWYYNINGVVDDETANDTVYGDIIGNYRVTKDLALHLGGQYLHQSENDKSGVEADIYGVMGEVVVKNLGINLAYNHAQKHAQKQSFSGFGGGTLFTNMDSMIIDAITRDRSADAYVGGISYSLGDINFLYAYGDFKGDADSLGIQEHIVEQDIGVEYSKDDDFTLAAIYTINDDKYNNTQTGINGGDWGNLRIFAAYNF